MVLLLLLPLDGSSSIIIILYALENFFVHLVSGYFSFLFSCFFNLLIPKSPSDCFTVKICVQLKSVATHQRALCICNKVVLQGVGNGNLGWNFQICISQLSA